MFVMLDYAIYGSKMQLTRGTLFEFPLFFVEIPKPWAATVQKIRNPERRIIGSCDMIRKFSYRSSTTGLKAQLDKITWIRIF